MSQMSADKLLDLSTADEFCFGLYCDECGKLWKSSPVRFSRSGVVPETSGKKIVFDTLYQREKEAALFRAAGEMRTVFSICPVCRRRVCDHCFLVCEELDMCVSCASRLQERGEPVLA